VVVEQALAGFLKKHRSIYLDTSVFIYFVEQHPRYSLVCEVLFNEIESGRTKASTSTLTMLEVLVQPYRQKNDELVLKFYALLTTYPHLTWIPMSVSVADQAAKLRADHGLKTPDAIQAASAISRGDTGFVCNDKMFNKVPAFECFILDDHC
jgi:predicted nucleic acid-binding protein